MSGAPGIHLSSLPVSIPLSTKKSSASKDRDLQEDGASPNSYVGSESPSTKTFTSMPDRPPVPQHKRSWPQNIHSSASQVSDNHARVTDSQTAVSWSVDAQKHSAPMKPAVPRKKRLPDIISNNVVATEAREFGHSCESPASPKKKPLPPRPRISTHPCNNMETPPDSRKREGYPVARRRTDGVASPRRKPPPIPQKKIRPVPPVKNDPDYVNATSLPSPHNSRFPPPTVVRDGQEYHILSQTPPQSKDGNAVNEMYTSVVNRYQISTVEEFPSELEASMHCYENEEAFPNRYQPLTRQTLEGSAEYCSTDVEYLNHPIAKLSHPNHRHWN